MKTLILLIILGISSSCAIKTEDTTFRVGTDNLLYGSGVIIGIQIGISETHMPVKATVGYEKYEFVSKPKADKSSVDIQSTDVIGISGTVINRSQHAKFGTLIKED